jgi:5'-3' exonuclease
MIKKTNSVQKPSLLIDASIYVFQYYFAMPDNWFSKKESWPTAAVYGYTTFLINLLKDQQPKRIAVCFDESLESCFRNKIYADYKSSRALPDEALAFQLNACKKVTQLLGIKTFASKTFEADDLLGSLYHRLRRSSVAIAVLTRDKDLCQLIKREQDFLWDYSASANVNNNDQQTEIKQKGIKYFPQDIVDKFGVHPHQMSDYLALVGDASDDIPGVPGVGKVTAQLLLKHFDSVEQLANNINSIAHLPIRGSGMLIAKIKHFEAQIQMAKKLATIVINIPLIDTVNDLILKKPDIKKYQFFCKAMGFPRLANSIDFL